MSSYFWSCRRAIFRAWYSGGVTGREGVLRIPVLLLPPLLYTWLVLGTLRWDSAMVAQQV